MPYGYRLEAEYESGYVLTEDDTDHSPFDPGKNIFNAILNGRPSDLGHGRLVRYSLIPVIDPGQRYDIDWRSLWEVENPRPIYFRQMHKSAEVGSEGSILSSTPAVCDSHHFGYQYVEDGKNIQEVHEITDW